MRSWAGKTAGLALAGLLTLAACSEVIGADFDRPAEADDAGSGADATATRDSEAAADALADHDLADGPLASDAGGICDGGVVTTPGTSSDSDNCGPCALRCPSTATTTAMCVDGRCGFTGEPAGITETDPADGGVHWQQIATDDTGRILMSGVGGEPVAVWFPADGGGAPTSLSNTPSGPLSIFLSSQHSGESLRSILGGESQVQFVDFTGALIETDCASSLTPDVSWAIDAAGGHAWRFTAAGALLSVPLSTPRICAPGAASDAAASPASAPSALHLVDGTTAYSTAGASVTIWNLGSYVATSVAIPEGGGAGDGAVTSDGSFFYTLRADAGGAGGGVGLVDASGALVWHRPTLPGLASPVITGPVGTSKGYALYAGTDGLTALDAASGAPAWTAPYAVDKLLVGDDGVVWATVRQPSQGPTLDQIVGIDVVSGKVRYQMPQTYAFLDDLLLEHGALHAVELSYVKGARTLLSIPVSSTSYDPASPWPVRGHDNQRTFNKASSLGF